MEKDSRWVSRRDHEKRLLDSLEKCMGEGTDQAGHLEQGWAVVSPLLMHDVLHQRSSAGGFDEEFKQFTIWKTS